jgi:lipopolysaccharide transport system permease protein
MHQHTDMLESPAPPVNQQSVSSEKQTPMIPTHSQVDHSFLRVLEPRNGWSLVNFEEVWRYRELLFFMMWRDVKVRYKQTVLGGSWAIIQPLSQMIVFTIFFHRMAQMSPGKLHYPLFAFAGLLAWMFFSNSVSQSALSVISNQNLISKVYFPRIFVPASAIGVGLVDFLVGLCMLVVMMLGYRVAPSVSILYLPLIMLGIATVAFGVGTFIAALTVEYRDFRHIIPFMVQIWMFATPTVYMDATMVGPRWQNVLPLNPMYGLIHNFRASMLGGTVDHYSLFVSLSVTVLFLGIGCLYFRRVERSFADVI